MPRIKVKNEQTGQTVVLDQIRQPLFDTFLWDNTVTLNSEKEFYSSVQGKAAYLTNLRQNNLLEKAVSFRVQGLAIDAQTVANAAASSNELFLTKLQERTAITLKIGDKNYWEGPMRFVTGRLTVVHQIAGTTDAMYHHSQYGAPAVAGVIFPGKEFIDIPELQSFRVKMTTADLSGVSVPAANPVLFVCSLKGLQRRPVQ